MALQNILAFIALSPLLVNGEIVNAGCGSGTFDDDHIYDGFGNVKPITDHKGQVSLFFAPVTKLQLEDGTELGYDLPVVPRFVDFNNDGKMDVLVAMKDTVYVHYQKENGKMSAGEKLKLASGEDLSTGYTGSARIGFAYVDLNGDGIKDVVITKGSKADLYYFPGQNNGVFGAIISLGVQATHARIDLADWDYDGDYDVIVGMFYGDFKMLRNTGSATEPKFSNTAESLKNIGTRAYNRWARVMDVNQDGKLDVVVTINWGDIHLCMHGDKGHLYSSRFKTDIGQGINIRQYGEDQALDLNDFDGDGVMDVITSGHKDHNILYFKGVAVDKKVKERLDGIMEQHKTDLGTAMEADNTLYNTVWDSHRQLQELVNWKFIESSTKDAVYTWYKEHLKKYPILTRQQWSQPHLQQLAAFVWVVMWETRPITAESRLELSNVTNQYGFYAKLFEDRGIFFIDNDKRSGQIEMVYKFMMLKNPKLYSLTYITDKGTWKPQPGLKYGPMRDSAVNIGGYWDYAFNEFGSDCQVCSEAGRHPKFNNYLTVLAHEVAHNELDQPKAENYNWTLFQRKFRLIQLGVEGAVVWYSKPEDGWNKAATQKMWKEKGLWDGQQDWNTVWKEYWTTGPGKDLQQNHIRNMIDYFVTAPQEAFATLANQYFSDSKLMLDFAMERAAQGGKRQLNVDWFILAAEYYTRGRDVFPMFVIGEYHKTGTMKKYYGKVERNAQGYINKIIVDKSEGMPGPNIYLCELNEEGLTKSCTATSQ